ncbi:MAG: ACT domain-containing protein [bacterium]|nr:ACT domain-containing protein [bacterium]
MAGENNLTALVQGMEPKLNSGEYIFSTIKDINKIKREDSICEFKESEGTTVVMKKTIADQYNLTYDYVASWITLTIHSSLEAVGLTAAFSSELAKHNISCNVIAGYYHDHIFVDSKHATKAMEVLRKLAQS